MQRMIDNEKTNIFFINRTLLKNLYLTRNDLDTITICPTIEDNVVADYSHLNILHVDDNAKIRSILQEYFMLHGCRSKQCSSGKEALSCLDNQYFDLIFMDKEMPSLDGIATTKIIRALPNAEKAKIPIIALTSDVTEEALIAFREAGANGFITKPFHFVDIKEMIQAALGNLQLS